LSFITICAAVGGGMVGIMEHLIATLAKYVMTILITVYTYYSFRVFRVKDKKGQNKLYFKMTAVIFVLHFIGYYILFMEIKNQKLIWLYLCEAALFLTIILVYQEIYPKISRLLLLNMVMLLSISFVILARLSFDKAVKQLIIVAVASLLCIMVPHAIQSFPHLNKYGWIYGSLGIGLLLLVLLLGKATNGATNWLNIAGISIQPSEFVKILFVLCIASMFSEGTNFIRVCAITVMAAANVLVLVFEKDLGGALIFFVTYIMMLYIATSKPIYLFAGLSAGSFAAYIAYRLFYHVRVRVMAWQNPFGLIDDEGFQMSQSLFAIGTGGWFGLGLNQGLPTSIPVVESDFIFSAIAEELGGFFAICIILIFINCFVMFISISLKIDVAFYRLLSLGLSVMIAFQVILSIGGVIKFIPSTGVTLPLISYGGSSIVSTIVMFMILQGLNLRDKSDMKMNEKEIEYIN